MDQTLPAQFPKVHRLGVLFTLTLENLPDRLTVFGNGESRSIPLHVITWEMIDSVLEVPKRLLQATIPGTGKDGGPSCATVKPIHGWKVVK